jgi:hypothetical protein
MKIPEELLKLTVTKKSGVFRYIASQVSLEDGVFVIASADGKRAKYIPHTAYENIDVDLLEGTEYDSVVEKLKAVFDNGSD